MKKAKIFALAALMAIPALASCKIVKNSDAVKKEYGETVTRSFDLGDFNSITLDGAADVKYTQGPSSVKVIAPEKFFELLDITNNNGNLVISKTDIQKNFSKMNKVKVNVICSSPNLYALDVNGAGDVEIDSLMTERLVFNINGAGDLDYKWGRADDLRINVEGAGDVEVKDVTGKTLTLNINGAGDATLEKIDFDMLSVDIEGAGDAKISGKARKGIFEISGVGDIDLRNLSCPEISTEKNGVGSIKK